MKDFNSYEETVNRCFLKFGNDLYCADLIRKYVLKWNGKKWEEFKWEKLPQKVEKITPENASKIATLPPWEAFNKIIKRQEEESKNYWENLIKTTKHRVIGYINTACGSDLFLPLQNGKLSDEEYAAIIKDYRKNGYLYSGEDFQDSYNDCTPVLDNYRWIDFSRRGFGALIAKAKGDYSEMGYCHYTENMFINPDYIKYPKGGLNKGITRATNVIEINDETFSLISQQLKQEQKSLISVPIIKTKKEFYWINDGVTLCFNGKRIKAKIRGIACFNDKEEFVKFLEYRRINCVYNEKDLANFTLLIISV